MAGMGRLADPPLPPEAGDTIAANLRAEGTTAVGVALNVNSSLHRPKVVQYLACSPLLDEVPRGFAGEARNRVVYEPDGDLVFSRHFRGH